MLIPTSFSSLHTSGYSFLLYIFLFFYFSPLEGQNISGVINTYAKVSSISGTTLTISNVAGAGSISSFDAGNKVLVIQMKGVNIESSNDADYGNLLSYGNAGNYEFTTVSSRSGSSVTLTDLDRDFDVSGSVQIVAYTEYAAPNVVGTITAIDWDNTLGRGGVVVLSATGNITLSANIDVSLQGFAGGSVSNNKNSNCASSHPYTTTDADYGMKGESVVLTPSGNYSIGKIANGGGGGAFKNAGGGGGGNFTAGGNGGYGNNCTSSTNGGGLGGIALSYAPSLNKVFLGGGGGGGQANNGQATDGSNGGGIAFLFGDTLLSACSGTYGIYSNGGSSLQSNNEGAGGGGAGGTISLTLNAFDTSCAIELLADGGEGGNVDHPNIHGGGGGGGIGAVLVNIPLPSEIMAESTPGGPGQDCRNCGSTGTGGGDCTTCITPRSSILPYLSTNENITETAGTDECTTPVFYELPVAMDEVASTITDFIYDYDNDQWTESADGDGVVDDTALPKQFSLTSANDNTSDATSEYCIFVPATGTLSFSWNYSTNDGAPNNDPFGYQLNGVFTQLTATSGTTQSGTQSIAVNSGDSFCFVQSSTDGNGGAATTTISGFSGPGYQIPVTLISGEASGSDFSIGTTLVQYQATFASGEIDTSSFSVTVNGSCSPVLPVELIYFVGKEEACDIVIQWATLSEQNASHFELLRSADGADFKTIASLPANGTTGDLNTYEYSDKDIDNNQYYYRLKQVDLDGEFVYYEIISISSTCFTSAIQKLILYPNPVINRDNLYVHFFIKDAIDGGELKIFNASGIVIKQQVFHFNEGQNSVVLDVSDLPAGSYFLNINNPFSKGTVKQFMIVGD